MSARNENPLDSHQTRRARRPFLLTLMFWIILLWVVLGWLRLVRVVSEPELIMALLPPWMFAYLLVAGLIWGVAGLLALWGLLHRSFWGAPKLLWATPRFLWAASLFYPLFYWFERLFLWRDPNASRNWLFMLTLTLLWFGCVIAAMRSQRIKSYFLKH